MDEILSESEVSAPRVLTVSLNPALDVSVTIEQLVPDRKLRSDLSRREPGGGGVNVARALRRLGVPSQAFVVSGGPVGAELVDRLRAEQVDVIDFRIDDHTRESLSISESSTGLQYRISTSGPFVDQVDTLRQRILDVVDDAGIVVVSGSLPPGIPLDFLVSLVGALGPAVTTIVDTSGPALEAVAHHAATIIKPSQRELAALVGWEPITTEQIEQAVSEVIGWGLFMR